MDNDQHNYGAMNQPVLQTSKTQLYHYVIQVIESRLFIIKLGRKIFLRTRLTAWLSLIHSALAATSAITSVANITAPLATNNTVESCAIYRAVKQIKFKLGSLVTWLT